MTTLVERPAPPTHPATLRTLAGIEARRYARHPLFLVGVALLVVVVATYSDNMTVTDAAGDLNILPAFFIGLLGVFVGFHLTRAMARSSEAVNASPVDGVMRTAALCLACLVPGAVALAWLTWTYVAMAIWPIPDVGAVSSADRAAILAAGAIQAVGGPLVGVLVGRWTRFPGAGLGAAIVLVAWAFLGAVSEGMSASRLSVLIHLNSPFTYWVEGPRDNHPEISGGSPWGYLAYITLLCGLAATAALLHESWGEQRTRLVRLLGVLGILALASLALTVAGDPTRIQL